MMMTRLVLNTALLATLVGGMYSCEKIDRKPPVVTLITPSAVYSVTVPDTIHVKFTALDDRQLTEITIELIDEQINKTGTGFTIYPVGNYIEVDTFLVVDDILLNSGKYYIRVRAHDAVGNGTAYAEILLTGVPRLMTEIMLFSSGNPANLYQQQSGIWNPTATFSGAISGVGFDALNQRLCISTNQPGGVQMWNMNNVSLSWSEFIANAPPALATGELHFMSNSYIFAILKQESQIALASIDGIYKTTEIYLTPNHLVKTFHYSSNFIVSLQREASGQNGRVVSNYWGGFHVHSSHLNETPVAVHYLPGNVFLIITNNGSQGRIRHFDPQNNILSSATNTDSILWLRKIDNNFLLATSNSVLQYANGTLSTFYTEGALDAAYDEVNNEIYLLKSGELLRLNSSGTVLSVNPVPGDATRLLCRYNK